MAKSWAGDIPNTHVRDYQRKKVYDAEDKCNFWDSPKTMAEHQFRGLINRIADWGKIQIPKIITQGHDLSYATPTEIVLPYPNTKNKPTICHEMAHVINYNTLNADHHGKYFCGTYLLIVKEFIGKDAHIELLKAFTQFSVDYLTSNSIDDILVLSNKIID